MARGDRERLRFGELPQRRGGPPTPESARSRTAAYVYGNILVLAAVVGVGEHAIEHGTAVLAVVGTGVITYVAHVFAENIGQRILRSEGEHRAHVREELRDATPTLTSGFVPAAILATGWAGWLEPQSAQYLAVACVVLRLAGIGLLVERLSGRRASATSFWSGIGVAIAGALIAVVKVALAH